jgi:hypothetical protein
MLEGPQDEVRIYCNPSVGVQAEVDGVAEDFGEGVFRVEKAREQHTIRLSKEGFHSTNIAFTRRVNPFWGFANLIWLPGYPIGLMVDWQKGSIYKVEPNDLNVVLRPL